MSDELPAKDDPSKSLSGKYRVAGIRFSDLIATEPRMLASLERAERLARSDLPVLLLGESGTGKNLVAQAMHNASPRRAKPYVEVTCGAIPETLAESELFGHVAGSFTGAIRDRKGFFELANGGTILLDEIDDLPLVTQAKLLRVLESKEFTPLGSSVTRHSDVRIVAATSRDLVAKCADRSFRSDLYQRLAGAPVILPPLRQRKQDIPRLAEYFLREAASHSRAPCKHLDEFAMSLLLEHDWPGNVRELRAAIRTGIALAERETVTVRDLGLRIDFESRLPDPRTPAELLDMSLASCERRHIERVLRLTGYKKSHAARMLGIARNTLDRKIEEFGLGHELGDSSAEDRESA